MSSNAMEVHHKQAEPWDVTKVDTGSTMLTSGRLKSVQLLMASYRWE
jgi:glucose-1-phosphate cytidylyltransferase